MTSENHPEDLHQGRGWLNRAAEVLDGCEDHVSDAEFAHAAAIIGNGFIALAHAERALVSMAETSQVRQAILSLSDEPETTLGEAIAQEKRAEDEARPHDNELVPVPCPRCEGCGQLASTPGREPWTAWENLPPGSDLAVVAGIVKPIPCDECDGTKQILRRREADRG